MAGAGKGMKERLAALPGAVLDLLYPRRCAWCGEVSAASPCAKCGGKLANTAFGVAPVALAVVEEGSLYIGRVYACFHYEPPVQDAIHRFKFEDEPGLAPELGAKLAAGYTACGLDGRYGAAVPVPVSPGTLRRRGYNQSALLAEQLCGACGLALAADALKKTTETVQQMTLGKKERMKNVQGAYEVAGPAQIAEKRILLVDDVATTGSTLNECAKVLLAAGAAAVDALCLAAAGQR